MMSSKILHNIHIDPQTYENLGYLKRKFDSPKTWIIRRLVKLETQKCKNSDEGESEVVAR
jgi:hypothetical protein